MKLLVKLISSRPAKLNVDRTAQLDSNGEPKMNFIYSVHGSEEDLKEYKTLQGGDLPKDDPENHYRESDGEKAFNGRVIPSGTPLYFSPRTVGINGNLMVSVNNKLYVDTTIIDLCKSLIKNHGKVGEIMAKELMAKEGLLEDVEI